MPLSADQQIFLTAAQGFVGLKMYLEANDELERIDPFVRYLPEVLAVRLDIYRALEKWELMQAVAKKLAECEPDEVQWIVAWADATRNSDSLEAGRRILMDALENHENAAVLHFNLACFDCQLGDVEGAKASLKSCFELDRGMRLKALNEPDLEPIWSHQG
jgi:tetratricopeptide (TPR) repeat protein